MAICSRRRALAVAAALALALLGGQAGAAGPDVPDGVSRGQWFVQVRGPLDAFRTRAAAAGVEYEERFAYHRLWNGVAVEVSADAVSLLGRLPEVEAVFPVLEVQRPEVTELAPELAYALVMTGADQAQQTLGLTGDGVLVAVMDTGIDYHHPDLGGGFGPGYRVVTGWDFVGDRFDSGGSGGALIPHPDADPDDCGGHGSHVAGIIGADGDPATGGARGVAPGVQLAAYRVFGCAGSTTSAIMLAAMERALADGVDVLNMSIGAAFQTWPQYPTAVGADALVDAGVVVVASIGNSGGSGVWSASAPGVGSKVLGTASYDNSDVVRPYFTATPDGRRFGYIQSTAAPPAPTAGDAALARTGTATSPADACSALPAGSLTGKVALVRRGTCSFYLKARNAEAAGASGVVLYNNVAGIQATTVAPPTASDPPVAIPVVSVSMADGVVLDGRIAAGATTLTWTDQIAAFPNQTGGLLSSFSSYGLTAELGLKPDLGAPGGLIRSTIPLENGGYATISGTSMASPHVAGAVALYLEAHPGASPAQVRAALQNTADPRPWSGNPGLGLLDAVHRQGAGMVDVDDAILAAVTVQPSKLSLGEGTAATPKTHTLTLANTGATAVTYTFAHQSGVATGNSTFAPSIFGTAATASFGAASVTVPAGGTATVDVTVTPPATAGRVYGGWLLFRPTTGEAPLRVPYAGISGDYQAVVTVLGPGGCASSPFPGVFKRGGETVCTAATATAPATLLEPAFSRQPEGATFNVEDRTDRPVILYQRSHQARRLEIRAVEVATGQSWLVAASDYVGRNASNSPSLTLGGYSTYTWDGKRLFTNAAGKVQRKELPAGTYQLQLVATKPLAEPGNAAHVEVRTLPAIQIVRIPVPAP